MLGFVNALREEIRRLARKEIKAKLAPTLRATAQHRREIARLKRQLAAAERRVARLESRPIPSAAASAADDSDGTQNRFSARSVRAQRKRLKLSAAEYGKLVGVSGQTIYQWEQGKSRPRKSQFAALIGVRSIGRREALARLGK